MTRAENQMDTCRRFAAAFLESPPESTLGVALHTLSARPIHGLRHLPAAGTCGWYIWGGEEMSDDPQFFQPLHVSHLPERCPEIIPYLGLAPGWRFLLAPGHEDVWFDPEIVHE
jgi:hypothetical protein